MDVLIWSFTFLNLVPINYNDSFGLFFCGFNFQKYKSVTKFNFFVYSDFDLFPEIGELSLWKKKINFEGCSRDEMRNIRKKSKTSKMFTFLWVVDKGGKCPHKDQHSHLCTCPSSKQKLVKRLFKKKEETITWVPFENRWVPKFSILLH